MTEALKAELAAAGYTDAQIAKEAAYLERVAWENRRIRSSRSWGFGFHHAGR
jgi:hypothetical protein